MPLTMPSVKQTVSPNYTPTSISHDLFVLHDQQGHTLPSVAWLCDPRAQASAHMCLSDDMATVYQLVPLSMKAWHARAANGRSISLEMPGFAEQGFADDLLRTSALIAAWCCRAYSIPLVWAQGGLGRGLACHHDGGSAWGGHTDVGPVGGDTWQKFVGFVREIDSQFGPPGTALPPFALNGLPGAHEVTQLPSDVVPAPSHGGDARSEAGDTHDHPTPSGFAAHSVAALQADLNKLTGAGLTVDGWFGTKTAAALAAFQRAHGLTPDGLIGPASWAAVDRATAV